MLLIDGHTLHLQGPHGTLTVPQGDEITRKLAMIFEGECEGLGPVAAARKFGYTKQRYYQLLHAYRERGAVALLSERRGPKTNYRRTEQVVRLVIRHRFLDPDASAEVIAQKLQQAGSDISIRTVERIIEVYGLQKKLWAFRPDAEWVESFRTRRQDRWEASDPLHLERGVRQLLAHKVSGNLVGIWLLVPEYLRLGTWDLLCGWTGMAGDTAAPRLGLQLVNEAALCTNGIRESRSLSQKRVRTRQRSSLCGQRRGPARAPRRPYCRRG